jgi:hypothetical protein
MASGCVEGAIALFADVAGQGPPGCQGCDGAWAPEDEDVARRLGVALPGFQLAVYDAAGTVRWEQSVDGGRPFVRVQVPSVCGQLPMTIQVVGLAGPWSACPGGSLESSLASAGPFEWAVPLTPGCRLPDAGTLLPPDQAPTEEPRDPPTVAPTHPRATPPATAGPNRNAR